MDLKIKINVFELMIGILNSILLLISVMERGNLNKEFLFSFIIFFVDSILVFYATSTN